MYEYRYTEIRKYTYTFINQQENFHSLLFAMTWE